MQSTNFYNVPSQPSLPALSYQGWQMKSWAQYFHNYTILSQQDTSIISEETNTVILWKLWKNWSHEIGQLCSFVCLNLKITIVGLFFRLTMRHCLYVAGTVNVHNLLHPPPPQMLRINIYQSISHCTMWSMNLNLASSGYQHLHFFLWEFGWK